MEGGGDEEGSHLRSKQEIMESVMKGIQMASEGLEKEGEQIAPRHQMLAERGRRAAEDAAIGIFRATRSFQAAEHECRADDRCRSGQGCDLGGTGLSAFLLDRTIGRGPVCRDESIGRARCPLRAGREREHHATDRRDDQNHPQSCPPPSTHYATQPVRDGLHGNSLIVGERTGHQASRDITRVLAPPRSLRNAASG